MTPKEAELLRAVAEKAERWANTPADDSMKEESALCSAIAALIAYRAQPQEAEGETVEVRGCAGVDERGEVYGYCSTREDDSVLRDQVESCGYEPTVIFTIRVPKSAPHLPTIPAKVVT